MATTMIVFFIAISFLPELRISSFHFISYLIILITLAGTPPTMVLSGTSFPTTAPAATMAFSPMVTPANIVALAPIQRSS
jgi:hypothetical protein